MINQTLMIIARFVLPLAFNSPWEVPISNTAKVELKAASDRPTEGMEKMRLGNTERDVHVAKEPLLSNSDISTEHLTRKGG